MKKVLSIFMTVIIAAVTFIVPASAATKISAPTSISVKSKTDSTVKLAWKASDNAAKYTIYYSTDNKSFKKYGSVKSTSVTVKKLSADTKYYFKVKASGNINGKTVTSSYSKVKSVKTEKKKAETSSQMVYIAPENGKKYHTHYDCQGLSKAKSIIKVTIEEAAAQDCDKLCGYCAKRDKKAA